MKDLDESKASAIATAVFAASAVGGALVHALRIQAVVISLLLFVGGIVLLGATLVIGASRSRRETIDLFGLFFTQAPMRLRLLFLAQVVVAFATAWVHQAAAFGILAPIAGLGLCGLWGARHGTFPERAEA